MQGAQSAGLSASAERRVEADRYQYDHGRSDGVVAAGEPHNSHHPTLTASHSHSTSSSSANPFAPLHSPLATAAGPSTFSQATSRLYAPRRNHTISSPGRSALNSRRLAQHFEVPEAATTPPALSQQDAEPATPTSPGTNSLKAIMGAADDDHDWERMIRNNAPLPDDPTPSTGERYEGRSLGPSHLRTGSSSLAGLADLPNSATGASGVRRHQSLNHAPGHRLHHHRLQTRASDLFAPGSGSSTFAQATPIRSGTPGAGSSSGSPSATSSPIAPGGPTPWTQPLSPGGSRFAGRFSPRASADEPGGSGPIPAAARAGSPLAPGIAEEARGPTALGSSLMDAHARLSRLSIDPAAATLKPVRESSTDSARTPKIADAPHSARSAKRLPSLITNRDVLARAAVGAEAAAVGASQPLAGPVSAAAYVPPIGHGHARTQSSDSSAIFASSRGFGAPAPSNPVESNATGPSAAARAAALSGPFTAMPAPGANGARNEWSSPLPTTGGHATAWHSGQGSAAMGLSGGLAGGDLNKAFAGGVGGWSTPAMPGVQPPPSQWGLGLTPAGFAGPESAAAQADAQTLALSIALAQQQARTNALLAGLSTSGSPDLNALGNIFGNGPVPSQQAEMAALLAAQQHGAALPSHVTPHLASLAFQPQAGRAQGLGHAQQVSKGLASRAPATSPNQSAIGQAAAPPALSAEVQKLIAMRGFNPSNFDLNPPNARWFVIKSFTEDDVQRSLKYEIWASTEKGNARLDKAWRESAHLGPLYLFFSVNASGHFNGMAQMLTPLDYSTSSNVWAQEGKWKGTFKVRWIYVKDVPNSHLRHIQLTNTPENKPITQSRDTQELPVAAGKELIRIMHGYAARTTLLQDWAFYEAQHESQRQTKQPSQQAGADSPHGRQQASGPLDVPPSSAVVTTPSQQTLKQSPALHKQASSGHPAGRHHPPRAIASPSPRVGQQPAQTFSPRLHAVQIPQPGAQAVRGASLNMGKT